MAMKQASLFRNSGLCAEGHCRFDKWVYQQCDPNSIQVQAFTKAWQSVIKNKYMYRLKIACTDQISFGTIPVLMVVKIIWRTVLVFFAKDQKPPS